MVFPRITGPFRGLFFLRCSGTAGSSRRCSAGASRGEGPRRALHRPARDSRQLCCAGQITGENVSSSGRQHDSPCHVTLIGLDGAYCIFHVLDLSLQLLLRNMRLVRREPKSSLVQLPPGDCRSNPAPDAILLGDKTCPRAKSKIERSHPDVRVRAAAFSAPAAHEPPA